MKSRSRQISDSKKLFLSCLSVLFILIFSSCYNSKKEFISSGNHKTKKQKLIRVNILSKYHPGRVILTEQSSKKSFKIEQIENDIYVNDRKVQSFSTLKLGFSVSSIWAVELPEFTRLYQGAFEIRVNNETLEIINELYIEDYLTGVLLAEFGNTISESLKSQAVLSRTLAIKKINGGSKKRYHVVDLTIDQAYKGFNTIQKIKKAILETKGEVITHNGKLITPFWHSTCAGTFYTPSAMWGGPKLGYLKTGMENRSIPGNFCSKSPHYSWENTISFKKIQKIIYDNSGHIIGKRYPKLKNKKIQLNENGKFVYPELFRLWVNRIMGWNFIKSNDHQLIHQGNYIVFKGKGLGHNIGLCQCEAHELAKLGQNYKEILRQYYKGIQIVDYRNIK